MVCRTAESQRERLFATVLDVQLHHLRQFGDSLVLEYVMWVNAKPGLAGASDDLDAEDGIPPQFKEIVVAADGFALEYICP